MSRERNNQPQISKPNGYAQIMTNPNQNDPQEPDLETRPVAKPKPFWLKPAGIALAGVIVGALAAGFTVGAISGAQNQETLAKYHTTNRNLSAAEEKIRQSELASDKAQKQITDLEEALAGYREKQSELDKREETLTKREDAVQKTEETIAANTFGGGVKLIGKNVTPGTYTSSEVGDFCYYEWKTDTSSAAGIVDNNIIQSGTATVTLRDGEIFESTGCGTWTRQG